MCLCTSEAGHPAASSSGHLLITAYLQNEQQVMTVATPSALAIHLQLAIWYINKKTLVNPKTTSSGRQPCQMLLRSLCWLRLRKGELGGRRSDPPANNCCLQCFFGSWILWISPWRQSQKPIHPLAPCQPNWNLVTQRAHQTLQGKVWEQA